MELPRHDDPSAVGPYSVVGRLDDAMGEVPAPERRYIARTFDGDRTVVVSVPLAEFAGDAAYAVRFCAEAEEGRRLQSAPWLAPVLESSGVHERLPWRASPYVPGLPIPSGLVALGKPFPERTVRALGATLAEALAHLHAAGFAHAGLSPAAVLLTGDGPQLTGFGAMRTVARDGDERSGLPGVVPECTAPEQLTGGRPRPLGDVFALGAVLSYATTGDLRARPEDLPEGLRDIIISCLARDPAARPRAAEVLDELARNTRAPAQAPAGEPATVVGGGPVATVLDSGTRAKGMLGADWLPGRVVAANAGQAAQILSKEQADVAVVAGRTEAAPTLAPAGTEDSPVGGGDDGSHTADVSPSTTTVLGGRLSRRVVVSGAAAGAVGGAIGFAAVRGAFASGGEDGKPPRRTPIEGVPPTPVWQYRLKGDAPVVSPVVWRDEVVVIAFDTSVIGLDLRSGKKLWTASGVVTGAPVDVGGGVIMLPDAGSPGFLSGRSGEVRWQEKQYDDDQAKGDLDHVLGFDDGVVWFTVLTEADETPLKRSSVVAYDVNKRRELWRASLPEGFSARPLAAGDAGAAPLLLQKDALVVQEEQGGDSAGDKEVTDSKRLVSLRRNDGREMWTRTYDDVIMESQVLPLAPGSAVAVVKEGLRAFRLTDGEERWSAELQSKAAYFGRPVAQGGKVYAADSLSTLCALDAESGEVLWHSDPELLFSEMLGGVLRTLVTPSGKTVLVVNPFEVVAFSAADGAVKWRFSDVSGEFGGLGEDPGRQIALGNDMAIVLSNKSVYALPVE